MSLMHYNFHSQYLNNSHTISVILPDKKWEMSPRDFYLSGKKYKVLWLLHGTFGDHTDWVRNTNIELYATEKDLIVVMPSALNSNYSNWDNAMMGFSMYDYLTEELMPLIYGWLPAADNREDNFIAGLSMGGRGAIKYAVNHPDKFAAAAVLSAVPFDCSLMRPGHEFPLMDTEDPRIKRVINNAGGIEAYLQSPENVWRIIDELAASDRLDQLPRIMMACGEDDTLIYENYHLFKQHCEEIGLEAEWFHLPGYKHEWSFWDLAIQEALRFFGL